MWSWGFFMDGFYVGKRADYIDKTSKKSSVLSLLAQCNGTEIMINTIKQDKLFYVDPSDNNCVMEFFYLLEGSVEYEDNGDRKVLNKGDYFYMFKITQSVFFKALDEVTLLYVSNQPVYKSLKDEMCELTEMVSKVEKKDKYTLNHSERVSGAQIVQVL